MTEAVIVSAQAEDAEAIAALAAAIWRRHYPSMISAEQIDFMLAQRYAPQLLRRQIGSAGNHWDKLLLGPELIGFANYFLAENPREMKLDKLYIHQDHQRSGYGGMLITRALQAAEQAGCSRLRLAVNKQNKNAIAAYRKQGFRIVESVMQDIGGGFVMDDFVMARDVLQE